MYKCHLLAGIGLLILLIIAPSSAQVEQSALLVDLGYVKYEGVTNTTAGINYFRGIHYALTPAGTNRWRAPIPIDSAGAYDGETLPASEYGPACYQGVPAWMSISPDQDAPYGQSEDCLLLDILVPIDPVSSELPVVVQFHSGGFVLGSSTNDPGDAMVNRSEGSLIYVQAQYRLGLFGFLGGNEVAENGVRNAGLLDQRAVLDWVQRHIDKFGGDPSKVTILGLIPLLYVIKTKGRVPAGAVLHST